MKGRAGWALDGPTIKKIKAIIIHNDAYSFKAYNAQSILHDLPRSTTLLRKYGTDWNGVLKELGIDRPKQPLWGKRQILLDYKELCQSLNRNPTLSELCRYVRHNERMYYAQYSEYPPIK